MLISNKKKPTCLSEFLAEENEDYIKMIDEGFFEQCEKNKNHVICEE